MLPWICMYSRCRFDIGWVSLLWAAMGYSTSQAKTTVATNYIQDYFPTKHTLVALSVRTLFDAILVELDLPEGSPIVMSGINIQPMADIVRAHGLRIVAVDIDPATLAPEPGALLLAQQATGAKICVLTQLFGAIASCRDLRVLRQRGVFVIEDGAQAFSGPTYLGCKDVAVTLFSFGPIKRYTALGGAVGLFQDDKFAKQVQVRLNQYPIKKESWFRRRAWRYVFLKAATFPFFYALFIHWLQRRGKDVDHVIGRLARNFKDQHTMTALRYQPPRRMIVLLAKQMTAAVAFVDHQSLCEAFLTVFSSEARVGVAVEKLNYWVLPLRVAHPNAVIRHLLDFGFDATRGQTSLIALCPATTAQARQMLENIIYLPHPARLSASMRQRLQVVLMKFYT